MKFSTVYLLTAHAWIIASFFIESIGQKFFMMGFAFLCILIWFTQDSAERHQEKLRRDIDKLKFRILLKAIDQSNSRRRK